MTPLISSVLLEFGFFSFLLITLGALMFTGPITNILNAIAERIRGRKP